MRTVQQQGVNNSVVCVHTGSRINVFIQTASRIIVSILYNSLCAGSTIAVTLMRRTAPVNRHVNRGTQHHHHHHSYGEGSQGQAWRPPTSGHIRWFMFLFPAKMESSVGSLIEGSEGEGAYKPRPRSCGVPYETLGTLFPLKKRYVR